jgi:hypothetical protein
MDNPSTNAQDDRTAFGLFFNKNEHPKGFGALEDCPIKKLRSSLAAAGFIL